VGIAASRSGDTDRRHCWRWRRGWVPALGPGLTAFALGVLGVITGTIAGFIYTGRRLPRCATYGEQTRRLLTARAHRVRSSGNDPKENEPCSYAAVDVMHCHVQHDTG
jgi:hypothetical protein